MKIYEGDSDFSTKINEGTKNVLAAMWTITRSVCVALSIVWR